MQDFPGRHRSFAQRLLRGLGKEGLTSQALTKKGGNALFFRPCFVHGQAWETFVYKIPENDYV
jgi:hypothetical protein